MTEEIPDYIFPDALLAGLLQERNEKIFIPDNLKEKRELLRILMNIRLPGPIDPEFLNMQDYELARQREEKGVIDISQIPRLRNFPEIGLWQGDITRLNADAIVNAANSQLLGCFSPLHNCIDNIIHSSAGIQLREECKEIMEKQGHEEAAGQAKITKGYNLPARWVIHTVGPVVNNKNPSIRDQKTLSSCYQNCLKAASQKKIKSIAFCCISTGVFGYPKREAAATAIQSVTDFINSNPDTSLESIIFNVFTDEDLLIYKNLLNVK